MLTTLIINKWLWDWCHGQGFGYLDHGICFEKHGLLSSDGVYLLEEGKNNLSSRLSKLMKKTLN